MLARASGALRAVSARTVLATLLPASTSPLAGLRKAGGSRLRALGVISARPDDEALLNERHFICAAVHAVIDPARVG
jgi:hypothetical protein